MEVKTKYIKIIFLLVGMICCFLGCAPVEETEIEYDSWEQLDFTEENVSQQGEGWEWDGESKTLTLNNLEVNIKFSPDDYVSCMFELPSDATVILADGSKNEINIVGYPNSQISIVESNGDMTIDGNGELQINSSDLSYGFLAMRGGTIIVNGGNISIVNSTEIIKESYYAFYAQNQYIQNEGTVLATQAFIDTRTGIMVNGGTIDISNCDSPMSVYDGDIVLNGGKTLIHQEGEAFAPEYVDVAISEYDTDWIINGGELFVDGILTSSSFIVNSGCVSIDGVGISLNDTGRYEQNGGKVTIKSRRSAIGNYVNSYEDNKQENRIILKGGELDITCTDERYNAIELILEKKRGQNVLGTGIIIGDNMKINDGEWITEDITKDSEIRLRDDLQDFSEEREYLLTALQSKQVSITSQ